MKPPTLERFDRRQVASYFNNTWQMYEWLFSSISEDRTLYESPDPLRHPLVFYLGHTAAFYVNKLELAGLLDDRLNPDYETLFEVGVDPERPEELERRIDWPAIADVRDYRVRCFDLVHGLIDRLDEDGPVDADHPAWALMMALEHDRIHFETSSMLIRQFGLDRLQRPEGWSYAPTGGAPCANPLRSVAGGTVLLGKPYAFPTFGWDNEYGERRVEVSPFTAGRNLVTNAEFREFVDGGGYHEARLWSDEGWSWRCGVDASHPKFWVPAGDGYRYRAMFDELDLPLDWPVEVNAHEATAYCRWLGPGHRLLREAEFVRLAAERRSRDDDVVFGDDFNLNLRYGSPCPVGSLASASRDGFNDVFGNVWCWLEDDFSPLPGFRAHPYYADFSEPFFDDRHAMLLGGAWATTGTAASQYYRLWFRRQFFQHAGFRVARDA